MHNIKMRFLEFSGLRSSNKSTIGARIKPYSLASPVAEVVLVEGTGHREGAASE